MANHYIADWNNSLLKTELSQQQRLSADVFHEYLENCSVEKHGFEKAKVYGWLRGLHEAMDLQDIENKIVKGETE